jgi:eukaryotic-like serine/threonine-protein kinase
MKLSAGSRLGTYEIIASIGRGGMGEVFKARDTQLGRDVAIKVLAEEFAHEETRLKRFLAEAKATSALNHPNILTVYGIGEESSNPYIVTEFIVGKTLRQHLANGPLPLSRAFEITLQTLSGLIKAHSIGIIHRDLKPENLMITSDGYVKILDFGLAKLLKSETSSGSDPAIETLGVTATESGMILGTAAYMSPEQARGQRADARSDLFSLGLILYEMISGKHPFWRATPMDTISAILRDSASPLVEIVSRLPAGVSETVQKALEKKPEDRFQSAAEFDTALRSYRLQISTLDNVPTVFFDQKSAAEPDLKPASRNRKHLYLVAVFGIVAAVGAILFEFRKPPAVALAGPPVIAVMAIENKTTDAELAKADVGRVLSDAFVQVLYDAKGVQVVSPWRVQSVVMGLGRKFDETGKDFELAQKVCTESEANTILSGSLSQIGETFVLNATLTALPGQTLIGNFQAQTSGKERLLEKLTMDIAMRLKDSLAGAGSAMEIGRNVETLATGSMEAYAHFLKGLELSNEGKFLQAAEELRKALEIDPNMAVAWSELACVYSFAGDDAKAQEAQNRALQMRSRLSRKEQLWIDSISLWLDGNGAAYRAGVEKYVHEFPDDRNGYFYIGLGWQWLDHDCIEAIQWYEKAYRLSPDYYPITKAIVDCQIELGQRQQAIRSLQRFQKVVPSGYGFDQAKWRLEKIQ